MLLGNYILEENVWHHPSFKNTMFRFLDLCTLSFQQQIYSPTDSLQIGSVEVTWSVQQSEKDNIKT